MDSVFSMRAALHYLLGVLLVTVASIASAEPPTTGYFWSYTSGSNVFRGASAEAVCEQFYAYFSGVTPRREANNYSNASNFNCRYTNISDGQNRYVPIGRSTGLTCSDGSAPDTSKPYNEQCGDPAPVCEAGAVSRETFKTGTGPLGAPYATNPIFNSMPTSDGTCNVDYDTIERCYGRPNAASTEQEFYCDFAGKNTGTPTPASENAPQPSSLPPEDPRTPAEAAPFNPAQGQGCPKGTTNIGTDSTGGSICAGSGTSPIAPTKTEVKQPTQTTTNPDGSTTQTEVTTRTNTDGSTTTTTKTTTTGADGKVTTTESSVTGDRPASSGGGAGRDDSSDETSDFCKKNPQLNVCKNSSVSGDCENTACEGDAITCAILRVQRAQQCKAKTDEDALKASSEYGLGNSILQGNDPLKDSLPSPTKSERFDVSQQLDDSGWLGGGSCFPDKTINIGSKTFVIPFSDMCDYLVPFRYMVMLMAAFFSLSILSRGVFGK